MFIVTAKVPKRRYFLLPLFIALILAAALLLSPKRGAKTAEEAAPPKAETNAERIAYLSRLGWEAESEPVEALRLTLPEELVEPYRSYNELQLRQGFDLNSLLGETLERYTYTITNYPGRERGCQADLYVFRGEVVAGDVICTGADGFIATLDFPGEQP